MTRFPVGASILVLLLVVPLCAPPLHAQDREEVGQSYPEGLYAELATSRGMIVLELDFHRTPMTVANFVGLAEGTIQNAAFPLGTPFFDGTVFQRVEPGHVIQGGRPASAQARSPGYTIPNEIDSELSHRRMGMLGMANGGPHTGSSQFYITLGDRSYLDGDYTVFGEVFGVMDVVLSVERGDTIHSVRIVRVGAEADAFRPDTESFQEMVRAVETRTEAAEEEKKAADLAIVQAKWPNAVTCTHGLR
jgi:peptidylprolyl isomerase